jgi:3-hydroxyacyl-[acyl-carrier-protein] dehydratase
MRLEYFQMVDRIEELALAEGRIRARAVVPETSTIFEGHFPGYPIMPGVLLIETMAQTSGYLLLALNRFERMPFLIEVRGAKLRSFVEPGTTMSVEARLEHDGSGFAITKARIAAGERAIADAEIRFRTLAFPSPELERMMRESAARIGLEQA